MERESEMQLTLLFFPSVIPPLSVTLEGTDTVGDIRSAALNALPADHQRVRVVFEGRPLTDTEATLEAVHMRNEGNVHIFVQSSKPVGEAADGAVVEPGRNRGLQTFLESGVDRQSVLMMRLTLLARTGYLTEEQSSIFSSNGVVTAVAQFEAPGEAQIRTYLTQHLPERYRDIPAQ
ncbi:hypothetical protein KIPB_002787, partial [Kipferlia bialata]|eukprot:g2787.t1